MEKKRTSPTKKSLSGILLMCMLAIALSLSGCFDPPDPPDPPKSEPSGPLDATGIVEKYGATVVNIYSDKSLGSGVIYQVKEGFAYVITNDHVVRNGSSFFIRLSDARTFPAKKIGTDVRTDIAILKVEATDLQAAEFADSSTVKKGQKSFAIGNAMGNENSVTDGIIRNANITDVDFTGKNINKYIQTSASINPGNSGGALFDEHGKIIGINDMSTRNADDINFAIPSNTAKKIADKLIKDGYVAWPYIGITEKLGKLPDGTVAIQITEVRPKSPAAEVGLRKGDIILKIGFAPVESVAQLRDKINDTGKDGVLRLTIRRINKNKKQEGDVEVVVGELPKDKDQAIDWS
ncbi:MAG: trypsin-like peptidase domain-containing protein [Selenomonadaceae bacterium]|nr:trypsin-like peptidase domain-containing protein [Selenomonadaceae bacterium]